MVKEWCQKLSCFPEKVWISYAKSRDPLTRLVSIEDYTTFYHAARECGMNLAREIREKWGDISCQEIAEKLGVRVEQLSMPTGDGLLTFACFHEPDYIQVFTDNAEATQMLIRDSGGNEILGDMDICEILLAHELFHVLQEKDSSLYVNQKHIRIWNLGPIKRNSKLMSLEEVAAMAFAQELLQMSLNPYVYDVLMLLPKATMQAKQLYERLLLMGEEEASYE